MARVTRALGGVLDGDEGSPGGEVQPLEPGKAGEEDHAPGEHVGFQILGAFLAWR